jgi:hypothetical protein
LGESDTLAPIRVEERFGRAAREYGFEFPGQIDAAINPGIHALPADRTVNVSRIAEQKLASLSSIGLVGEREFRPNQARIKPSR